MRTPPESTDAPLVIPPKPSPDPAPVADVWTKTGRAGVEQNQDGKLRTNIPRSDWWAV